MSDPLATYLHDHLAGARIAVELLEAMQDHQKNQQLKLSLAALTKEVQQDRETLQQLAEKIGSGSNVVKELTGWLGEKATRLKLGQVSGGEFGTFEALEFVTLGVKGKVCLWLALDRVAPSDARLLGYDFKQLALSAERQFQAFDEQRLHLAERALGAAT